MLTTTLSSVLQSALKPTPVFHSILMQMMSHSHAYVSVQMDSKPTTPDVFVYQSAQTTQQFCITL
jgi:hypothetical protein